MTRVLSEEALGSVYYYQSLARIGSMLVLLGIPLYGVSEISKQKDGFARGQIVAELVIIKMILLGTLVFFAAIYLIVAGYTPNKFDYILVIAVVGSVFSFEWLVQGLEGFKFLALRNFVVKLLMLGAIFVLVNDLRDGYIYFAIISIGSLLMAIANFLFGIRSIEISLKDFRLNTTHIAPLATLFGSILAISVYTTLDVLILEKYSSRTSIALYGVAMKFIQAAVMVMASMSVVFLPLTAKAFVEGSQQQIINVSLSVTKLFGFSALVIILLFSVDFIALVAGPNFIGSNEPFKLLSAVPLFIGLSNIYGVQVLVVNKKNRLFLGSVIAGALVSVVSNLILVPDYGEIGAAISNLVAEFIVLIFTVIFSRKILSQGEKKFSNQSSIVMVLFAIVTLVLSYFVEDWMIIYRIFLALTLILSFALTNLYLLSKKT